MSLMTSCNFAFPVTGSRSGIDQVPYQVANRFDRGSFPLGHEAPQLLLVQPSGVFVVVTALAQRQTVVREVEPGCPAHASAFDVMRLGPVGRRLAASFTLPGEPEAVQKVLVDPAHRFRPLLWSFAVH